MPHDALSLLQFPGIRDEFTVKPEQAKTMMELNQFRMQAMQKASLAMQKAQAEAAAKGTYSRDAYDTYKAAQEQMNAEIDRRLGEMLTPEQQSRIRQVQIQMLMKNYGFSALATPALAEELNLTETQLDQLVDKQIEMQKELQEMIKELRAELEDAALEEVLTSTQKSKLSSLTGKRFEPKFPNHYDRMLRQQLRPSKAQGFLKQVGKAVEQVKKDFSDEDKEKKK